MLRRIKTSRDRRTRTEKSSQFAAKQIQSFHLKPRVWIPVWVFFGGILLVVVLSLFEVKFNPLQVSVRQTGFGQSYSNDVSTVTERTTETTGTTTKTIDKTTTTTTRDLQPAKTLWDLMPLLLAPATLAGLGFLFQYSQERARRDREEADKARSADQQREQALQTYFDQLSELLVDKKLKKFLAVKEVETDSAVEKVNTETAIDGEAALDVVKARTLALLRMFDQDIPRKASVLSFLADADLLKQLKLDLSGIQLAGANLKEVNFSGCKLQSADLSRANLSRANFIGANLSHVCLRGGQLRDTNLIQANLISAELMSADLIDSELEGTNLSDASLKGADLIRANIKFACLYSTKLEGADLKGAELNGTRFWDTHIDLNRAKQAAVANIKSAKNWQLAHYDPEMQELLGLVLEGSKVRTNN